MATSLEDRKMNERFVQPSNNTTSPENFVKIDSVDSGITGWEFGLLKYEKKTKKNISKTCRPSYLRRWLSQWEGRLSDAHVLFATRVGRNVFNESNKRFLGGWRRQFVDRVSRTIQRQLATSTALVCRQWLSFYSQSTLSWPQNSLPASGKTCTN